MTRKLNLLKKTEAAARRNHIVVSDIHAASKLGLCHPDGHELDEGGIYSPSRVQQKMWRWWDEFWGEWVPRVTHNEPYTVVVNGDAIDGDHHNTSTTISRNSTDQVKAGHKILHPIVEACEGRYDHLRGTEAHSGEAGREEEALAYALGAVTDEAGRYARFELYLRCGSEKGRGLVHYTHAIGTSSSSSYESTAVHKELVEAYSESGRWNLEMPQVVVRSHRHRYYKIEMASSRGYDIAFVTPSWQLKTPFVFKLGLKLAPPQLGGCIIRYGDEELHTRAFVKTIERPTEA